MNAEYTGQAIAQKRKEKNLTQRQLAEMLHVTDKAVSKWERGINFPDLGILEPLAEALETTPACLLGLEDAKQNELLSSITEISNEQLEQQRRSLARMGWGSIVTAILLVFVYQFIPRYTVQAYQLLHVVITAVTFAGIFTLFQHGEIKPWGPPELGTFFGAMLPVLVILGYHFLTGYGLPEWLVLILIAAAVVFAQIHCIQVFRPKPVQLLPLVLSLLYILYRLFLGGLIFAEWIPALCALGVLITDACTHPGKWKISWKAAGICLCLVLIAAILLGLLCYPILAKNYLRANADTLEAYAKNQLQAGENSSYGLWEVSVYPDSGLVLFHTGGSGLAPGSIYEGFYYSASGAHTAFPGFTGESDIWGDTALFRDPAENSDNYQDSTHIVGPFFWFELHY